MAYPGFNSFWNLSEEILDKLAEGQPLSVEQLFERIHGEGGRNISINWRIQVPLETAHIKQVLDEQLRECVRSGSDGWEIVGPRPPHPPIWMMFSYPWGSMGYRMAWGEAYWDKWTKWYQQLDKESQSEYRSLFPEPPSWQHFYEMMEIDPRDDEAMAAFIEKRDQSERDYIQSEYELALQSEAESEFDQALYHYCEAINRGGARFFPDIEERYERLQQD